MNKFATLVEALRFKKVTFYTVRLDEHETNLFLQFINAHADDGTSREELATIRKWIGKIGSEIGATAPYFRSEAFRGGDASALPPPAQFLETSCDLRLYCMRVNSSSVVLFGGAVKTAPTAQECNQVRPHFMLANKLTKAIHRAIQAGDIKIHPVTGRLVFDENLTLEIT
ncbi:MAG: hypothetical protein RI973_2327 [Bacteroidota bacterium]